jgi:hypothetical protein
MKSYFELLDVDVYPNGSIEILCVDKDLNKVHSLITTIEEEFKNIPNLLCYIENNRDYHGKVNGESIIILNSIKETNRSFQIKIIEILDKYSIDYSNSDLTLLKTILNAEKSKILIKGSDNKAYQQI